MVGVGSTYSVDWVHATMEKGCKGSPPYPPSSTWGPLCGSESCYPDSTPSLI